MDYVYHHVIYIKLIQNVTIKNQKKKKKKKEICEKTFKKP